MKNLILIAAAVCGLVSLAAPQSFVLKNGTNLVSAPGEIVGIECMTVDASQVVTAKVVTAVTELTNAYKTVTVPHMRYDMVLTNWNGSASLATNELDHFDYADWIVLGTNHLVSVKPVATNIATQVADGTRVKATYTKETAIGDGTASGHYLLITPGSTLNFFGGRIDLSCGEGDNVRILVK